MPPELAPTLFDYTLTDATDPLKWVSKAGAEKIFSFFKGQPLFRWQYSHNGCEARADAICILLQQWNIPHYKAWVFSGDYLKKHIGGLIQHWNYHVAPALPVTENGQLVFYIIDPATASTLQTMEAWAAGITQYPHSYHFIKLPHWYLFHQKEIRPTNWYPRDRQNRKWMIQGLAGINGLTTTGKAQLSFNKSRIKRIAAAFERLKKEMPLQKNDIYR
ncbi:MAG: protein-glutamine glutaminase family protein [Bacteroidota bacterium]